MNTPWDSGGVVSFKSRRIRFGVGVLHIYSTRGMRCLTGEALQVVRARCGPRRADPRHKHQHIKHGAPALALHTAQFAHSTPPESQKKGFLPAAPATQLTDTRKPQPKNP
mmetsp:Transcript_50406/g.82392  ORF Transcript_50406/g.82392 Transcript_50406/m.82392 type:complete len:110 (+) Transcript_50406:1222-1551(+)